MAYRTPHGLHTRNITLPPEIDTWVERKAARNSLNFSAQIRLLLLDKMRAERASAIEIERERIEAGVS